VNLNRVHSTTVDDEGLSRGWLLCAARAVLDEATPAAPPHHLWDRLPHDAEAQHLAPLLDLALRREALGAPDSVVQQIRALALRHAAWHRARTAVIAEMFDAFDRVSIEALVLKGAALAWMIYPAPALRPMSDIDLMVRPEAAARAQAVMRELGFSSAATRRRFGRNAHHLPAARRSSEGLPLDVELHLDALSRDTRTSITMHNLTEPPQAFVLDGIRRFTLGHIDTLRHLTHHLLEPSPDGWVRPIGVLDVLRYVGTFDGEIDWQRLERFSFVTNVLRCLDYVAPLPRALERFAPEHRTAAQPIAAGGVMRPLRAIVNGRPFSASMVHEIFNPPAWWLHAYYNVPVGHSLTRVRALRHPCQMLRWTAARLLGV
jgi:hypothetical protein